MKVVTVNSEWMKKVLKKAKMEWPKELVEVEFEPPCAHQKSRGSTPPFCVKCGEQLRDDGAGILTRA
jgi:hypothetical protein